MGDDRIGAIGDHKKRAFGEMEFFLLKSCRCLRDPCISITQGEGEAVQKEKDPFPLAFFCNVEGIDQLFPCKEIYQPCQKDGVDQMGMDHRWIDPFQDRVQPEKEQRKILLSSIEKCQSDPLLFQQLRKRPLFPFRTLQKGNNMAFHPFFLQV